MKFSSKQKKRRKHLDPGTVVIIKQVLIGISILSVVAVLVTIIWYVTRIDSLSITEVEAEGGLTIDKEIVEERVRQELEGAYFRLVPKRFSWFYPEESVLAGVNEVERIKDVVVEKESGTKLRVTYGEYLPDALWCGNEDGSECYFLDETGFSFSKSPQLSGASVLKYRELGEEPEKGVRPFAEEDYQITREFSDLLQGAGWFVSRIEIDSAGDVFYILSGKSEIKATLSDGAKEPFEYLETIRQSKEFEHLTPGNFQYIDLRFGSKVYVNEEMKGEDDGVATSSEEMVGESEVVEDADE